jgi:hypothetical protein
MLIVLRFYFFLRSLLAQWSHSSMYPWGGFDREPARYLTLALASVRHSGHIFAVIQLTAAFIPIY